MEDMTGLEVRTSRGVTRIRFCRSLSGLGAGARRDEHLLVDARVAQLYARPLRRALASRSVLRIEATERNKSLEALPRFARHLIERGVRRDHRLVAVGGGVVLEIAAFLAGTLLRGVRWRCYPTTLLAQADACIGGKSSLNVGPYKNQLGTVTPPQEVVVSPELLDTLPEMEFRSGLGEVIKAHILSGSAAVRWLSRNLGGLRGDRGLLERAILTSLKVKKRAVEADEFDLRERMLLNYGHTFGHALEAASGFHIPHGIVVTVGMEMANRLSERLGLADKTVVDELSLLLDVNLGGFRLPRFSTDRFFSALMRDKKGSSRGLRLVLLREPGRLVVREVPFDRRLRGFCGEYFRARWAPAALRRSGKRSGASR